MWGEDDLSLYCLCERSIYSKCCVIVIGFILIAPKWALGRLNRISNHIVMQVCFFLYSLKLSWITGLGFSRRKGQFHSWNEVYTWIPRGADTLLSCPWWRRSADYWQQFCTGTSTWALRSPFPLWISQKMEFSFCFPECIYLTHKDLYDLWLTNLIRSARNLL